MANQKNEVLSIGTGAINSNTSTARVFASSVTMGTWSSTTSYPIEAAVEYSGAIYKSLSAGNLNNTPSATSSLWQLIATSVHDGDTCHVIAGYLSDIQIRSNGTWLSALNLPFNVSLANNTSGLVARFPLTVARAATIQYSIINGSAYRTGTVRYNSNGVIGSTGTVISDSNIVDIGGDVGIVFDVDVDGTGTYVELTYTSTNLNSSPAQMSYTIQRWT